MAYNLLGAVCLTSLLVSSSVVSASTAPPLLGQLVDVGGYRVHLYCMGQGSPTVVVAGGGFSFDWGLVQPKVAKFTRVCTFDTAGTAWSDPAPRGTNPNCNARVKELHRLFESAKIEAPIVLVGFSIGGLISRLYAADYPDKIAGMVLVDHAFTEVQSDRPPAKQQPVPPPGSDSPPALVFQTPIVLDIEDDRNFSKLPERDQALHRWAISISPGKPTPEMLAACFVEVDQMERTSHFPLGNRPLAVISTSYDSPHYAELQPRLLRLSHNSRPFMAENSTHMVIIDQPATIVRAMKDVVMAAKSNALLQN